MTVIRCFLLPERDTKDHLISLTRGVGVQRSPTSFTQNCIPSLDRAGGCLQTLYIWFTCRGNKHLMFIVQTPGCFLIKTPEMVIWSWAFNKKDAFFLFSLSVIPFFLCCWLHLAAQFSPAYLLSACSFNYEFVSGCSLVMFVCIAMFFSPPDYL